MQFTLIWRELQGENMNNLVRTLQAEVEGMRFLLILALQKESLIIKYLTTKIVIKHNCFGENFFLWENLNSIFPRFFYPFISEVVFKFKVVCQIFKFLSYTQCGRFLSLIIK